MNIGIHVSFWISVFVFFRYTLRSGIAWSHGSSNFSFLRNIHSFPQWLHQFTFPLIMCEGSLFSTSWPTFVICVLFDESSLTVRGDIHCGFDLHFADDQWYWASFFFNDTATTEIYTLSLHDALPIFSILFSIVAVSIYIPTNSVWGFPFLHTLSSIYCL